MAISIDWITGEITVPKADTQLSQIGPPEIRTHDTDAFRLELKDLEDDAAGGRPWPRTHNHNLPVTIAGVTYARTLKIIAPYFVTYEDGQYRVSLTGSNNNIVDVATVNQVSIISNNSAGLTFSEQINDQSFLGKVWVDTVEGLSGTSFPRGTPTDPVLTFDEGMTIALARKLKAFHVSGTVTPTVSLARYAIDGNSPEIGAMVLTGTPDTTNAAFNRLRVSGTVNGPCSFYECAIDFVAGFEGAAYDCALLGSLVLDAAATAPLRLVDCHSDVAGTTRPTIDFNGAVCNGSIRNYNGGATIAGVTQGQSISIDCNSATIELDATCTSGTFNIRGIGYLIDNSGPGCTVSVDGLIEPPDLRLARDHARAANLQTQQV